MLNQRTTNDFAVYLKMKQRADNTVKAYRQAVNEYISSFDSITQDNLLSYKASIIEKDKPSTVNQKICAINSFLKFTGSDLEPIKQIKVQNKSFLDNVISDEDYEKLKLGLRQDKPVLYFIVKFMACTGMRISEVLTITVDDVFRGTKDITSKGGKSRTIYIPTSLADETIAWVSYIERTTGYLFLNSKGYLISASGVRQLLKHYGKKYGIEESKLHPHAFRHYFSIKFLEARPDIPMLSDILGHNSIETTRLYLRKSKNEQMRIINAVVMW